MFWTKHWRKSKVRPHSFLQTFSKTLQPQFIRGILCFYENTNSSWPAFQGQTVCQNSDHKLPSCSRDIVRSRLFVHIVWMGSWPRTYVVIIRAERRKQSWEESSRTSKKNKQKLHDVTRGIKKSVLFIRKKWSWIPHWPIYGNKQHMECNDEITPKFNKSKFHWVHNTCTLNSI